MAPITPLAYHSEQNKKEICDCFKIHLTKLFKSPDAPSYTVRILLVGVTYQLEYLKLWILEMLENYPNFRFFITTIVIPATKEIFESNFFKIEPLASDPEIQRCRDRIIFFPETGYYEVDFEFSSFELPAIKGEWSEDYNFDLIFSCYQVHNCLNWRASLLKLLSRLNDNGLLVFAEIGGDYAFLDGNFKTGANAPDSNRFRQLMLAFDYIRNSNYHFWKPEISLTNYRELRNQIELFFDTIVDGDSRSPGSETGTINGVDVRPLSLEEFLVLEPKFSYFKLGLPDPGNPKNKLLDPEKYQELGIDSFMDQLIEKFKITRSDQFYIAQGFKKKRWDSIEERQWNFNALTKDLAQIRDNKIETLGQKALDLLMLHDVMFADLTWYVSIISWEDDLADRWGYPIHLAFNNLYNRRLDRVPEGRKRTVKKKEINLNQRILSGFWRLFLLEKITGFSLLKILFKQLPQKFPLIVERRPDREKENWQKQGKEYRIYEQEERPFEWMGIFTDYDRKGKVQKIVVAVSNSLAENIVRHFGHGSLFDPGKIPETKEYLKTAGVRGKYTFRASIREKINELVDKRLAEYQKEKKLGNTILIKTPYLLPQKAAEELYRLMGLKTLEKYLKKEYPHITEKNWADWIVNMAVRFQLDNHGWRLAFFPSAIIDENIYSNSEPSLSESVTGLGGIILYERLPGDLAPCSLKNLIQARDRALAEANNLIFFKASIASYVNRDFRKQSLLASVAGISARSGAHTLGSHVLPEVCARLQKIMPDEQYFYEQFEKVMSELDKALGEDGNNYKSSIKSILDNCIQKSRKHLQMHTGSRILIQYLQHRMDFITQTIGDLPSWTSPTWFVRELMLHFYEQYYLLDSIADTEKISACDYNSKEAIESDWFNVNNSKWKALQPGEKIWVYGRIYPIFEGGTIKIAMLCDFDDIPDLTGPVRPRPNCLHFVFSFPSTEEARLKELLKDSGLYNYYGQRVKIRGMVTQVNRRKKTVWLSDSEFEEGKLVVKIRKRAYVSWDKQGGTQTTGTSKYLRQEDTIDAGHRSSGKRLDDVLKRPDTGCIIFGPIEWIKRGAQTKIGIYKNGDFEVELNQEKAKKSIDLKTGMRAVFQGELFKEKDKYVLKNADLLEFSRIKYITSNSRIREDELDWNDIDVQIAIPGGVVGNQAFFAILENVIRNAAKHNWVFLKEFYKIGRNLEVKIELDDQANQDHYICKVWTNSSDLRFEKGIPYKSKMESPYPHFNEKALSKMLNHHLRDKIMTQKGQLNKQHLGLSEIKICSAFLAREDWTKEGHLDGDEIFLEDKSPYEQTGFIRASMILEEEAGHLVPRLGFRFKLLKPKEVVIVGQFWLCSENKPECKGQKQRCKDPDCSMPAYANANFGINCLTLEEAKGLAESGKLDYEFCILYDDGPKYKESDSFAAKLLQLLDSTLCRTAANEIPADFQPEGKYFKLRDQLSQEIEKYPYRLFVVTSWASSPAGVDFIQGFHDLKPWQKSFLRFFRTRVYIWDQKSFEEEIQHLNFTAPSETLADSCKKFCCDLYCRWLTIFRSSNHNYKFDIKLAKNTGIDSKESDPKKEKETNPDQMPKIFDKELIPSLPPPLLTNMAFRQGPSWERIRADVLSWKKGAKTLIISYHRHNNARAKEDKMVYTEGLTGKNNSFSLFKNPPPDNPVALKKVKAQLLENGMNTIMILDERVFQYVEDAEYSEKKHELRTRFQSVNLIVPSVIEIQPNYRLASTINDTGLKEGGNFKKLDFGGGNFIEFYQPFNTEPEKAPYRITMLVAHQTIIEHLAEAVFDEGPLTEKIDRLVKKIKHEMNIPSVVITSGRGRSHNTSQYAKYMPFSNIASLVMKPYPDRLTLTRTMFKTLNYQF